MLYPAYLWIGPEKELSHTILRFLKNHLCKNKGCGTCADCINIDNNRHYAVRRLFPDNYYTIGQLEDVFTTLSFALQPDEHFFFIFERADLFNQASANSLLKSLEEPPAGYHFILVAPHTDGILPTIRSRCVIDYLSSSETSEMNPLFSFFITPSDEYAVDFIRELEREKILERDVHMLVDQLGIYWQQKLSQGYAQNNDRLVSDSLKKSGVLAHARTFLPMSGSAKLFLKSLYLRLLVS